MSFLKDIQGFSKQQLKTVSTEITTTDGRRLKETRDKYGRSHVECLSDKELGFVGDVKPDLQVGEVIDGIILGSQDVAADLKLLEQYKVTHVINAASMVENFYPDECAYLRLDILDLPETNITEYFPRCFDFINNAIERGGCVLIHCNAGVSRSATICIGYLMKCRGKSFQEAFDLVKEKRPSIRPNEGFLRQLKQISV